MWICKKCGAACPKKYCGNCGERKPSIWSDESVKQFFKRSDLIAARWMCVYLVIVTLLLIANANHFKIDDQSAVGTAVVVVLALSLVLFPKTVAPFLTIEIGIVIYILFFKASDGAPKSRNPRFDLLWPHVAVLVFIFGVWLWQKEIFP